MRHVYIWYTIPKIRIDYMFAYTIYSVDELDNVNMPMSCSRPRSWNVLLSNRVIWRKYIVRVPKKED